MKIRLPQNKIINLKKTIFKKTKPRSGPISGSYIKAVLSYI